jgi:hypothetical protein
MLSYTLVGYLVGDYMLQNDWLSMPVRRSADLHAADAWARSAVTAITAVTAVAAVAAVTAVTAVRQAAEPNPYRTATDEGICEAMLESMARSGKSLPG